MLRIINLSKRYGRKKIFSDASLSIPSTGVHIMRGENGYGKTTLFKCLAGLEQYQGSILWHNESLKNNVTAVFDDSTLHGRLTGFQNLRALLDAPSSVVEDAPAVKEFLNRDLLEKRSAGYSLGQRKKIKLAAAFASEKPCILLDEPVSGLDVAGQDGLLRLLDRALNKACILISAHETSFYREVTSSEFTIRHGKIRMEPDEPLIQADDFDE